MAPRSSSRSTESINDPSDLVVGIVRAPHGLRGEVAVEPLTDRPERFQKGSKLISVIGEIVVRAVRGTAEQPILSFEGVTDRTAADRLRGELRVPRERRTGEHLWVDLVGKRVVTPEGRELGTVREVLRAGGADVLVVSDELMLPMIDSVIREIGDVIVAVPQEDA
jgi:16S rRNA processing protein RimM